MEQSFFCQGKRWTRRAFPDVPVKVAERKSETRSCPTVSTTWEGTHILSDGEREMTVSRSTVIDAGELGASVTYSEAVIRPGYALEAALAKVGWRRTG